MNKALIAGPFLLFIFSAQVGHTSDFWIMHTIDNEYPGADGIHLHDIDHDGDLDAVVGFEEAGKVIVYRNPGPNRVKTRWPGTDVSGGIKVRKIEDAKFADLDGDGEIDAVISATESHNTKVGIHWLLDPSNWTEKDSWKGTWIDPRLEYLFLKIAIGQIDAHGGRDIVVGTKRKDGYPGKLVLYRAPSNPTVANAADWRGQVIADIGWVKNVEILDMDGDGDDDVLTSSDGLAWYENPGAAELDHKRLWRGHSIGEGGQGYLRICTLDIDDGPVLVSGLNLSEKTNTNYLGSTFKPVRNGVDLETKRQRTEIRTRDGIPKDVEKEDYDVKGIGCGDLNNDGLIDLVYTISGFGHGVFALLQSKEDGVVSWNTQVIASKKRNSRKGIKHDTVELTDLDDDGDLDIITTEENGDGTHGLGVIWFENPTTNRPEEPLVATERP